MKKPETLQEKILFGKLVYFPLCEDYIQGITRILSPGEEVSSADSFNRALSEEPPVQSMEDRHNKALPWSRAAGYALSSGDPYWLDYGYGTSQVLVALLKWIENGGSTRLSTDDSWSPSLNLNVLWAAYEFEVKLIRFLS